MRRIHILTLSRLWMIAISITAMGAAPEATSKPAKEVPKVVMKNLRMEGQNAGKDAIELPRKKFLPIDADLEAGTWGFSKAAAAVTQVTFIFDGHNPETFPEQSFTHPVLETDPGLRFTVLIYRGEKFIDENIVGGDIAFFGSDAKPWLGKIRYHLTTPDKPGEYTLRFRVSEMRGEGLNWAPHETIDLTTQRIVIR